MKTELELLCPGRVRDLGDIQPLAAGQLDAAVITSMVSEKSVSWTTSGEQCILPMESDRRFFECGAASRQEVLSALEQSSFEPAERKQ